MHESPSPFVHHTALVETDSIGSGTRIWAFVHVQKDVTIGDNCNIGDHCFIESHVTIGDNVTVKNGVSIWRHVRIADNVFLGPNVALTNDLFPRSRDPEWVPVVTEIEDGVTIGANATIVCGIRLGRLCFVGAGSVVTRDVAPHALVAGNPARQRGWVCQCARPLVADENGNASCAYCSRQYEVAATGVVQLS